MNSWERVSSRKLKDRRKLMKYIKKGMQTGFRPMSKRKCLIGNVVERQIKRRKQKTTVIEYINKRNSLFFF